MKKSILIVDDDERLRELLKDFLTEKNLKIYLCEDFSEAKDILSFLVFDLIILDRMMPSGDGIKLVSIIKDIYPTPVIGGVGLIKKLANPLNNNFKNINSNILIIGKTFGHLELSAFLKENYFIDEGKPPEINLINEISKNKLKENFIIGTGLNSLIENINLIKISIKILGSSFFLPLSFDSSTIKPYPIKLPPAFLTNLPAADAVPPVANKSSIINILLFSWNESCCSSNLSSPYSSL